MLPGFIEKVRRGQHRFKGIVGWYNFRETIPCALSDCGTPHNRGYVVEIIAGTKVGYTNIGHICGRQEFGEEFQQAHVAAERFLDRERLKQSVAETLEELPEIERRARRLLQDRRGATWLKRAIGSLARACPARIYEDIVRRSTKMNGAITRARRRTEDDPPNVGEPYSPFVTETLAVLDGIGGLAPPYPTDIIEGRILKPLCEWKGKSAADILDKGGTRRAFQAWRKGLLGDFEAVERKLAQAQLFFTPDNLKKIALMATRLEESEQLAKLAWDGENGVVTGIGPVQRKLMEPATMGRQTANLGGRSNTPTQGTLHLGHSPKDRRKAR